MTAHTVRELMSTEVTTLERNEKLSLADSIMSIGRIRHMPVLDEDGKLVGLLSQRDLFHSALVKALGYGTVAKQKMLEGLLVKEVMTNDPVTVSPDTDVAAAASIMAEKKFGCLPVVEGDDLVGILTEGDFVGYFARGGSR